MRQVKFGYWADFRNPEDSGRSFVDLYRATFRQIERAEELGFNTIWFTEHHFTDDGYLPVADADGGGGGGAHQPASRSAPMSCWRHSTIR